MKLIIIPGKPFGMTRKSSKKKVGHIGCGSSIGQKLAGNLRNHFGSSGLLARERPEARLRSGESVTHNRRNKVNKFSEHNFEVSGPYPISMNLDGINSQRPRGS